ncbi:MAG TPA: hypothetical protein VGG48_01930 [Rhizomicrobium sp.]|jgi:methylmalonyl-CoA mutase N-terminal domain/subunit
MDLRDVIEVANAVLSPLAMALAGHVAYQRAQRKRTVDEALDGLRRDMAAQDKTLLEYQIKATETFASIGYLRDVENRVGEQYKRLDEKLDRLIAMMAQRA